MNIAIFFVTLFVSTLSDKDIIKAVTSFTSCLLNSRSCSEPKANCHCHCQALKHVVISLREPYRLFIKINQCFKREPNMPFCNFFLSQFWVGKETNKQTGTFCSFNPLSIVRFLQHVLGLLISFFWWPVIMNCALHFHLFKNR